MANGVQLATAYISLNVDTRTIRTDIEKAFSSADRQGQAAGNRMGVSLTRGLQSGMGRTGIAVFAPLQTAGVRWAARAGTTIAMTLRNAITGVMKTAGIGLGIGAGLGVGSVLGAGLDRLKVLQGAQVQLRVMKKSAEEIRQITQDVLAIVEGTPISLDDAMQAVPQALGAGVKQGKELQAYIAAIGDAAASTGGRAGFGQISMIFSQILGKGKLMGEEVLQLEENGVRIRNALMNTFGWTGAELQKNIEDGKVGMAELQKAVQGTLGGLSKQMGTTFQGATDNLKASVARLGANILSVIFGDPDNPDDPLAGATEGVTKLTEQLNAAGKWVKDNREEIRGFFRRTGEVIGTVGEAIQDVWEWLQKLGQGARDVGSDIASAFDTAVGAVGRFFDKVRDTANKIKTSVEDIVNRIKTFVSNAFNAVFGPDSILGQILDKLGIGTATASAAATGPVNAGPAAPSAVIPGTIGPGSGGTIGAPASPGGLRVGGGAGMDTTGSFTPGFNPGPAVTGQAAAGPLPASVQKAYEWAQSQGITPQSFAEQTTAAQRAIDYAKEAAGKPYEYGGVGPGVNPYTGQQGNSWDCSGIAGSIWAAAIGLPTDRRYFTTDSDFLALGFKPGYKPGALNIGTNGGSGSNGHMALTLPNGVKVESSGDAGTRYGDGALGSQDFTQQYHFELPQGFASGGKVRGPGTGTSDSIPAMLSNGEHVLTAEDVRMMGGQERVYAFRQALRKGVIPGFAPGGAVDPNIVVDTQNRLADLQNRALVASQQFEETNARGDASQSELIRARQEMERSKREYEQAAADAPIVSAGGTPPDRRPQNRIFDTTDQLELAQQQLADLQASGDADPSQMTAATYAVEAAKRDRAQAIAEGQQGQTPSALDAFSRMGGFVPVAAGNTGVAGTSAVAGILNMGSEVAGSLIDTGASLAQTAVSAAVTGAAAAGSFGAAAPAAPAAAAAANYGIQVAANITKRATAYGFQMAGIGADALIAQLFPFGAPRWLGYDYTQFLPQMGLQDAAIGTLEQMGQGAIQNFFNPQARNTGLVVPAEPTSPASPEDPLTPTGGSDYMRARNPEPPPVNPGVVIDTMPWLNNQPGGAGGGRGGGGSWAKGGEVKIYDQGGVLKPGDLALNASRTPERILTDKQWDALSKIQPAGQQPLVKIDAIYGMSPEDVAAQIESKQKLAMMRYSGRP